VPPMVTINQATGQSDPTNASTINFTVVFSESVTGFTNSSVTLSGTARATTATVTGKRNHYNVAVSGMTGNGTVIAAIAAGAATDAAGNPNLASTSTDNSITYDNTPPSVTINQATTQADPTNNSTIHFTATFSEPVADFTSSDVTLQFLKYSVTDLGTLGGQESEAFAINNAGQVVGTSVPTSSSLTIHAFLYSGGRMIDLGALNSSFYNSYAFGINEKGQVVGYADFPPALNDNPTDAYLYNGSGIIDLGTTGGSWGEAYGINDSGQIVGANSHSPADLSGEQSFYAFLYNGTSFSDLGNLGGSSTTARAINNSGQIVGYSSLADNSTRAFLYNGSTMVTLGTLGGSASAAYAINDKGDIVGYSSPPTRASYMPSYTPAERWLTLALSTAWRRSPMQLMQATRSSGQSMMAVARAARTPSSTTAGLW